MATIMAIFSLLTRGGALPQVAEKKGENESGFQFLQQEYKLGHKDHIAGLSFPFCPFPAQQWPAQRGHRNPQNI